MSLPELIRPHYFSKEEDNIILSLFDWCDTGKLSILMNLKKNLIVDRHKYLTEKK